VAKVKEEYCWAKTQVALRSCCGRSVFVVSEFGFELDCLVYIRIYKVFKKSLCT
jgi:hypothetical protein